MHHHTGCVRELRTAQVAWARSRVTAENILGRPPGPLHSRPPGSIRGPPFLSGLQRSGGSMLQESNPRLRQRVAYCSPKTRQPVCRCRGTRSKTLHPRSELRARCAGVSGKRTSWGILITRDTSPGEGVQEHRPRRHIRNRRPVATLQRVPALDRFIQKPFRCPRFAELVYAPSVVREPTPPVATMLVPCCHPAHHGFKFAMENILGRWRLPNG